MNKGDAAAPKTGLRSFAEGNVTPQLATPVMCGEPVLPRMTKGSGVTLVFWALMKFVTCVASSCAGRWDRTPHSGCQRMVQSRCCAGAAARGGDTTTDEAASDGWQARGGGALHVALRPSEVGAEIRIARRTSGVVRQT